MKWPEDPDIFFDGYADQDATIGDLTVRAIVSDSPEATRGGSPIAPVIGEHSSILIRKSELPNRPENGTRILTADRSYSVKFSVDSGGCWKITATHNQRRGP